MSTEFKLNFNKIIINICNQLLSDHKLITNKTVIAMLSELHPEHHDYSEESINNAISAWRIAKLDQEHTYSAEPTGMVNVKAKDTSIKYNQLLQDNFKYKQQLVKAKRELQFLKAKIQALTSFYNRQRKEIIMKVEGMLYKNGRIGN